MEALVFLQRRMCLQGRSHRQPRPPWHHGLAIGPGRQPLSTVALHAGGWQPCTYNRTAISDGDVVEYSLVIASASLRPRTACASTTPSLLMHGINAQPVCYWANYCTRVLLHVGSHCAGKGLSVLWICPSSCPRHPARANGAATSASTADIAMSVRCAPRASARLLVCVLRASRGGWQAPALTHPPAGLWRK